MKIPLKNSGKDAYKPSNKINFVEVHVRITLESSWLTLFSNTITKKSIVMKRKNRHNSKGSKISEKAV